MSTFQKIFVLGRLGADPELRYTAGGSPVVTLSVATEEQYKQKKTTTWHRVVAWDKTADFLAEHAKKGRLVHVEGVIQQREWEDRSGQKRTTTEIRALRVQLVDNKPTNESADSARIPNDRVQQDGDDGLPF